MANLAEIRFGQLAMERSASSEVKQFGQHMVEGHTKANEEVKEVAQQEGVQLPTELDQEHKKIEQRLSNLKGAEFDKAYMDLMVKNHRKDVREFAAEAKHSKDEKVRNLAQTLTPVLRQHLQMATDTRQELRAGRAE